MWRMFSVLPGAPLVPTLAPVTGRGGKGGERGARSSQAWKLDLGGGVGDISQPSCAWNLQRPAISSKSAPHALDISDQKGWSGNPFRAGDFLLEKPRQEPVCLPVFRNPNSSCAMCPVVELYTVRVVCSW